MNTRMVLPLSILTFVLTIFLIATSDISVLNHMKISVRRLNWSQFLKETSEYRAVNLVGKFFNGSTDGMYLLVTQHVSLLINHKDIGFNNAHNLMKQRLQFQMA